MLFVQINLCISQKVLKISLARMTKVKSASAEDFVHRVLSLLNDTSDSPAISAMLVELTDGLCGYLRFYTYYPRKVVSFAELVVSLICKAISSFHATSATFSFLRAIDSVAANLLTIPSIISHSEFRPLILLLSRNSGSAWGLCLNSPWFQNKVVEMKSEAVEIKNAFKMQLILNFCECFLVERLRSQDWKMSHSLIDPRTDTNVEWPAILTECMSTLPLYSLITKLDAAVVEFPDKDHFRVSLKDERKGGLKILQASIQLEIMNACEKESNLGILSSSSDHVLDLILQKKTLAEVLNLSIGSALTSSLLQELDVVCAILDIYAQALTACTPLRTKSNTSLQEVTVSTRLLNCLAFTQRSLTPHLWTLLKRFDICRDPSSILIISEGKSRRNLRVFFCFCSIFHHQLQGIDDDELFGIDGIKGFDVMKDRLDDIVSGQRLFSLEDLREIMRLLKQYLYQVFWVESFADSSKSCSLFELQCMLAATKLFNHLCMRNERRNFINESDLLWASLSPLEFTVVNASDGPSVVDIDQEAEDEGAALEGFRFVNQKKAKFVLTTIPQVVSFRKRVEIFQTLIESDRERVHGLRAHAHNFDHHVSHVEIHRRFILEDSAEKLGGFRANQLKDRIQVTFISDQGTAEAGIDGGGLFKEFLDELCHVGFNPSPDGLGLFTSTSNQLLVPSSSADFALGAQITLRYFNFLGKMLGKAVYERILVAPEFSPVFLNAILGRLNHIDDLVHLDAQVYQSLMQMKRHVQGGGDASDFELTFQIAKIDHKTGSIVRMEDLIPSGQSIPVTNENVISYIHKFASFRLNSEISVQSKAFLAGFRDIIPINWIRMFNPHELQLLLGGDRNSINIQNLRANVIYSGGYHDSHWCIQALWSIVESMTVEEQGLFLKFITSCPRQPLLGFEQLNPKLGIQRVAAYDFGVDIRTTAPKLPSAATCFNLLKLPEYSTSEVLKEKLMYAIYSNSGFELS